MEWEPLLDASLTWFNGYSIAFFNVLHVGTNCVYVAGHFMALVATDTPSAAGGLAERVSLVLRVPSVFAAW